MRALEPSLPTVKAQSLMVKMGLFQGSFGRFDIKNKDKQALTQTRSRNERLSVAGWCLGL